MDFTQVIQKYLSGQEYAVTDSASNLYFGGDLYLLESDKDSRKYVILVVKDVVDNPMRDEVKEFIEDSFGFGIRSVIATTEVDIAGGRIPLIIYELINL